MTFTTKRAGCRVSSSILGSVCDRCHAKGEVGATGNVRGDVKWPCVIHSHSIGPIGDRVGTVSVRRDEEVHVRWTGNVCSFFVCNNIIIIFNFYKALNTNVSKCFTNWIGHWIQCLPAHNVCTISTPWEHSSQALHDAQKLFDQQRRSHPTRYPFNTWVESSKYRLISCQGILVPCITRACRNGVLNVNIRTV